MSSEKFNFGNGKSLFQESEWLKSYKKEQKNKKAYEKQQAKLNSIVSKNETYTDNAYDFKWDVNNDGVIEYYQKKQGAKDWKLEKNNGAIFGIAEALGHLSKEDKEKLKKFKKQKQNQKDAANKFDTLLNNPEAPGRRQEPESSLETSEKPKTVLTGAIDQKLLAEMNIDGSSDELTYYTEQKNKIKEIQIQRTELQNKAQRFAKKEGYNQEETLAFVNKELANFDEQYGTDIELITEINGLTKLQKDALVELTKDTGNNASIGGNIAYQFGNYLNSALKIVGVDLEEVFRNPEVIDLNNEIEFNIVNSLSKRELEKLAGGYTNLKEKEELINKYKIPVIERKSQFLSTAFENVEEMYKDSLETLTLELDTLKSEMNALFSTGLNTQSQLNAYTDLTNKYVQIFLMKKINKLKLIQKN